MLNWGVHRNIQNLAGLAHSRIWALADSLRLGRFDVTDRTRYLLILFLVALLARIIVVALFRFDGLYGQDPYAYYNYSLDLREAFGQQQPPPPFFWPIGYPLLVVLGTLLTDIRPLSPNMIYYIEG
jgi:hypothetical protein